MSGEAQSETPMLCQVVRENKDGDSFPLTVGERFELFCSGIWEVPISDKAGFKWDNESHKYILVSLGQLDSGSGRLRLSATSYVAGSHKALVVKLEDSDRVFVSSPMDLVVESVLEPMKKPEPVPSVGPFSLSYPFWVWALFGAFILAIVSSVFFVARKRRAQRKLMEELESYMTMLPPFSQFSKDMRLSARKLSGNPSQDQVLELMAKLDEDFRLYLIRELKSRRFNTPIDKL